MLPGIPAFAEIVGGELQRTELTRNINKACFKKLFDVDEIENCTVLEYNRETEQLINRDIEKYYRGNQEYFTGDIVLAYKFGYPKNKTYSKLKYFFKYPTLLYAPFTLPKLYLVKNTCISGFIICLIASLIFGSILLTSVMARSSR